MVQRALLGLVTLLAACSAPQVEKEPLPLEAAGDGFALRMPEDAELLSRELGSGLFDSRVVSDEWGVLLDVTVHPAGQMPPLRADEFLDETSSEPRRVYRQMTGDDRLVVGYVWRRGCEAPTEIAAWILAGDVAPAPSDGEKGGRRALADAVATSIRVTPCDTP